MATAITLLSTAIVEFFLELTQLNGVSLALLAPQDLQEIQAPQVTLVLLVVIQVLLVLQAGLVLQEIQEPLV
jgi:hypothetical protein